MDSLTHIVLGAAIGETVLGKKIGKKAMLWGAFADTIPDFDVFMNPFLQPADALISHRGITHSFLFCFFMAPLFGKLFERIFRRTSAGWKDWSLLFFLGMLTHILLDSLTTYGTGLFEPFSHYRVTFNTIFIIDPFYTFPLLISFIALLILKKDSAKRKYWNRFGLTLSSLYLLFTVVNKNYINSVFERSLKEQHLSCHDYFSSPTPLNNILWSVAAKGDSCYWIGYYSLFDKDKSIAYECYNKNENLAAAFKDEKLYKTLQQFSGSFYCISQDDSLVRFNDLRFGLSGGWNGTKGQFVFSMGLKRDSKGELSVTKNAWSLSRFSGISTLIDRIKGK